MNEEKGICQYIGQYETGPVSIAKSIVGTQADGRCDGKAS